MAKRDDHFSMPCAPVTRIAKEALPKNISLGKDAKTTLAKAASVFVLYITCTSNELAKKTNRKTINGNDIIDAMHETGFSMYADHLKENLQYFRKMKQEKKDSVVKQKLGKDGKSPCVATKDDADEVDTD